PEVYPFPWQRLHGGHNPLAVVGKLESTSEERVAAEGGRRQSDLRGVAVEDGGRLTGHRVWRTNDRHGQRGGQLRERVSEDRERIREGGGHLCRGSTGSISEYIGFSRSDSRKVNGDLGNVSWERLRGDGGRCHSTSWKRLRRDRGFSSSDVNLSEVGSHQTSDCEGPVREDRGLRFSDSWEGVREVPGPQTSDSGERASDYRSRRLSDSFEEGTVDGGHSLSNSWEGVSDDRGYAASDSSAVSASIDASRCLSGFWERESIDEGSSCGSSWERTREDGGPGPSDDEGGSHCSGSWVTASEDRGSSRSLDSIASRGARDRTMPGVSDSGPSISSRETATP
ncbi:uncharacterized protein LOC115272620, partial [Suricata suricatta]|uniref:uncharacterized protein LOC115272620 n=1 Tax=Suricata suricatta TaxID=37032 RepID=UPI00115625A1